MGKSTIYNVLIIGAGEIGAFYDFPGSENTLTHAHAFSTTNGFRLLGFVDNNREKAKKAVSLWGGEVFHSLDEVFAKKRVDVVCLAVPDELHHIILRDLQKQNVKLVFAEKPLTRTWDEALDIYNLYTCSSISLLINYSRRFVPEFAQLRKRIANDEFGLYLSGNGYYGKGLVHNGSHLLDTLRYLLGEIQEGSVIHSEFDFYEDDPNISGVLNLENNRMFYMQSIDCRFYSIFELDLLFEKRRIRITNSGFIIEEYEVDTNRLFTNIKSLGKKIEINTSLGQALRYAALNIYRHLEYGEKLCCSLEDGYRLMEICQQLKAGVRA